MHQNHELYILLGSNLGNRKQHIFSALKLIREKVGSIKAASSLYQTSPWGKTDQPEFFNLVIRVETDLGAEACMEALLDIETTLGRIRTVKYAARTIDLDILYYDRSILNSHLLTVPHPCIADRKFVLVPLTEISPDFLHPVHNLSNALLLERCSDQLNVKKL